MQNAHWFLSTSLSFWKTVHTRPQRGCFGVTESLLKRLSCLQSHYASLIRARHYVVMFQRSCCSMLPPPSPAPHTPHYSLFLLLFLTGSSVVLWPRSAEQLWQSSQWDQIKVWGLGTLRVNITCGGPNSAARPTRVCKEGGRPSQANGRTSRSWDRASDTFIRGRGEVLRGSREGSGSEERLLRSGSLWSEVGVRSWRKCEESWKRQ